MPRTKWGAAGHDQVGSNRTSAAAKIRVNLGFIPVQIDTNMIAFRTPEQREERMKQVPMHTATETPEEVCAAGGIPASPTTAATITGAEIAIDGAASA